MTDNTGVYDFDVSKVRVMGRRLLVRMCFNPDIKDEKGRVLIVLPDKTREFTHWAEILQVGPKCKWFKPEHVGLLVRVDEGDENPDGYNWLGDGDDGGGYWFVDEDKLDAVVYET